MEVIIGTMFVVVLCFFIFLAGYACGYSRLSLEIRKSMEKVDDHFKKVEKEIESSFSKANEYVIKTKKERDFYKILAVKNVRKRRDEKDESDWWKS